MTRLDLRAQAARDLARVNAILGGLTIEAPLYEFTTPEERALWVEGVQRARREVTRAELALHDLTFGPHIFADLRAVAS